MAPITLFMIMNIKINHVTLLSFNICNMYVLTNTP